MELDTLPDSSSSLRSASFGQYFAIFYSTDMWIFLAACAVFHIGLKVDSCHIKM